MDATLPRPRTSIILPAAMLCISFASLFVGLYVYSEPFQQYQRVNAEYVRYSGIPIVDPYRRAAHERIHDERQELRSECQAWVIRLAPAILVGVLLALGAGWRTRRRLIPAIAGCASLTTGVLVAIMLAAGVF